MALTLDMVPEQAIELLNAHKHKNTGDIGAPVGTAGLEDYAVTEPKLGDEAVANRAIKNGTISKEKLDTEVRELIAAGGGNGLPGVADFIAEGLEITPSITDLSATVEIGTAWIGEKTVKLTAAQSVALDPRMASLLYAQKQTDSDVPLIGKVNAVFPEPDNNTIAQWRFNQTSAGAAILNYAVGKSSIAVANDLIPSGGLTSVDGWIDYAIKTDGSTGYYASANLTNFPTATATRVLSWFGRLHSTATVQFLISFGPNTAGKEFSVNATIGGELLLTINGSSISTGYIMSIERDYWIYVALNAGILYFYVDGVLVYSVASAMSSTATALYVARRSSVATYANITTYFVELRNAMHTPAQIAQIANKLLLPCFYTNTDGARKDIREVLPVNAISLGRVLTTSLSPLEVNKDYKIGRREKAYGGNRRQFLGWMAFAISVPITWDNPFGTRDVIPVYVWAQDANGQGEGPCVEYFSTGSNTYGISKETTSAAIFNIAVAPGGAAKLNGAWKTTGYIGCYAEVRKDD